MKGESSRTFIGSVVCVDLVGYSKRSIAEQRSVKYAFNELLSQALADVPPAERIILDTGDGAAVSFLGDPEACLRVGLRMRDVMNAAAKRLGVEDPASGPVRIGINLGPVRVAEDMNGRPNIIGDGINVAERLVGFAQPGEVVVSRSFRDMLSRMSEDHARIFRHQGVRTDSNSREHEIYVVESAPPPALPVTNAASAPGSAPPRPRDARKMVAVAAVFAVIVAALLWTYARRPAPPEATTATPPPRASEPRVESAPAPAAEKAEAPKPAVVPEVQSAPRVETPPPRAQERKPADAKRTPPAPPPPAPAIERAPPPREEPRQETRPAPPPASTQAIPVARAPVNFPVAAASRGIDSGTVRARLAIDAAGNVTQVEILSAEPPRVFDREAIRSLEAWKFNAGADGRAYDVEIGFKR